MWVIDGEGIWSGWSVLVSSVVSVNLGFGGHFAWLQSHLEAFFTLENDVGLQLEVRFLEVGVDAVVSQHCREQDLKLQHGVLAT